MKYLGYTINAEVITDRAVYSLDDNGNIETYISNIDSEPEISYYSIEDVDGDIIDWVETLEQARAYIDNLESLTCDKCREVVHEQDLIWITAEDFEPQPDEIVKPEAYKQYNAVCGNCYGDIIELVEVAK